MIKRWLLDRARRGAAAALLAGGAAFAVTAHGHHSFSVYDSSVVKIFTGVVTRVNPDANHLQIFFAPMNEDRKNVERGPDGKPIVWAVEMSGSAQSATEGITVSSFAPGTIISVGLHPLRNGEPAGAREGALIKCPERSPPAPGMHCDSVEGHATFSGDALPGARN